MSLYNIKTKLKLKEENLEKVEKIMDSCEYEKGDVLMGVYFVSIPKLYCIRIPPDRMKIYDSLQNEKAERDECIVCMERRKSILVIPCKHFSICDDPRCKWKNDTCYCGQKIKFWVPISEFSSKCVVCGEDSTCMTTHVNKKCKVNWCEKDANLCVKKDVDGALSWTKVFVTI